MGYSTYENVVEDEKRGRISTHQAKVLLGVHESFRSLASKPSRLDIMFLNDVYSGSEVYSYELIILL